MKGLIECKKYKEMAMEAVDGLISNENKTVLTGHIKNCPECAEYLKDMQKIRKAAMSIRFEPPAFLETRIMARITGKRTLSIFNPRPALAFAASFGLVMIVSILIIYKNAANPVVKIADMPAQVKKVVAMKPAAPAVTAAPKIAAPAANVTAQKPAANAVNTASNAAPEQQAAVISNAVVEHGTGPSVQAVSVSPIKGDTAPTYSVVRTGDAASLAAAKVTPIPPVSDNPLLDKDLAIVANNLINPLRGDAATIRVKVIDPARVKIIIYDKAVRPVSKILDQDEDRGTYEAQWYGRNDSNMVVSEGIYFVYIQIGTRVIKKSIIVNK
jgi:anti-sigma factor RsiW